MKFITEYFKTYLSGMAPGAARIRRFARGRWPYHLLKTQIMNDLTLDLDPDNYIERKCIEQDFYEREVLDTLMQEMRSGDVFWDVGANIGIMSLALKKQYEKISFMLLSATR